MLALVASAIVTSPPPDTSNFQFNKCWFLYNVYMSSGGPVIVKFMIDASTPLVSISVAGLVGKAVFVTVTLTMTSVRVSVKATVKSTPLQRNYSFYVAYISC